MGKTINVQTVKSGIKMVKAGIYLYSLLIGAIRYLFVLQITNVTEEPWYPAWPPEVPTEPID